MSAISDLFVITFAVISNYWHFLFILISLEAKVDILNYLGASHAESQVDRVAEYIASDCDCVAVAAIEAAGRIGGEKALEAIMAEVATAGEGKVYDAAIATLLAFKGSIDDAVVAALEGNESSKAAALQILQKRRITEAADKVLAADNCSSVIQRCAYNAVSKYIDNDKAWTETEALMKKILDDIGINYVEADDEAAAAAWTLRILRIDSGPGGGGGDPWPRGGERQRQNRHRHEHKRSAPPWQSRRKRQHHP